MNVDWLTYVLQVAAALLTAVVTAILTVRLSLRRFYSEKWWERKAEAYAAIIDNLHHMRRSCEIEYREEHKDQEMSAERKQELKQQWDRAYDDLKRRIDVGAFILSSEAVAALQDFEKEFRQSSNTDSWYEHMEMIQKALRNCLKRMRDLGRKDLKVHERRHWLPRVARR